MSKMGETATSDWWTQNSAPFTEYHLPILDALAHTLAESFEHLPAPNPPQRPHPSIVSSTSSSPHVYSSEHGAKEDRSMERQSDAQGLGIAMQSGKVGAPPASPAVLSTSQQAYDELRQPLADGQRERPLRQRQHSTASLQSHRQRVKGPAVPVSDDGWSTLHVLLDQCPPLPSEYRTLAQKAQDWQDLKFHQEQATPRPSSASPSRQAASQPASVLSSPPPSKLTEGETAAEKPQEHFATTPSSPVEALEEDQAHRAKRETSEVEEVKRRAEPKSPLAAPKSTAVSTLYQKFDVDEAHIAMSVRGVSKGDIVMHSRHQEGLQALAKFLRLSKGRFHQRILPYLYAHLEGILRLHYKWEKSVSVWKDHAPPDAFVYRIVTELLDLKAVDRQVEQNILYRVLDIFTQFVERLKGEKNDDMVLIIIPAFHGLICALEASTFHWEMHNLQAIKSTFRTFLEVDAWSLIDHTIAHFWHDRSTQETAPRRLLARYWRSENALNGARLMTKLMRFVRNVLLRLAQPALKAERGKGREYWQAFVATGGDGKRPKRFETIEARNQLKEIHDTALRLFRSAREGSRRFASTKDQPGVVWYWGHLMASSLQVAVLSSLGESEINSSLFGRMTSLLSEDVKDQPGPILVRSDLAVQMACLDSLTVQASAYPSHADAILGTFQRILLLSPSAPLMAQMENEQLIELYRSRILHNYSTILKERRRLLQSSPSTVSSFLNAWYSVHSAHNNSSNDPSIQSKHARIAENIVHTLGCIVKAVESDQCIQAVMPILIRRLGVPVASKLDALIIEQLAEIALMGDPKVFKEVVDLFSVISRGSIEGESKWQAKHTTGSIASSSGSKSDKSTAKTAGMPRPVSSTSVADIAGTLEQAYVNDFTIPAVLKAQMEIAERLNTLPSLYIVYLTQLLNLFVDKGAAIQRAVLANESVQASSLASEMGQLLPILKALLTHEDFEPHLNASPELKALFRNAWFYCILYCFVSKRMWIAEWYDAVAVLARNTPVLIATGWVDQKKMFGVVPVTQNSHGSPQRSHSTGGQLSSRSDGPREGVRRTLDFRRSIRPNRKERENVSQSIIGLANAQKPDEREKVVGWFESDLELNAILRYGSAEQDLPLLRASLASILPTARSYDLKYLTFAQMTYLLSFYHVESLRIHSTHSLRDLFQYFSAQIVLTSAMQSCMDCVALKIVDYFVDLMKAKEANAERETLILAEVEFLLQQCISRGEKGRIMGRKALKVFLDACPWIIWSRTFLCTVLEVLQIFYSHCGREYGDDSYMGNGFSDDTGEKTMIYTFPISGDRWEIDIVEDYAWRKGIVREIASWCISWISRATKVDNCAEEIVGRLKHFLAGFRELVDEEHVGRSGIDILSGGESRTWYGNGHFGTSSISVGSPGFLNTVFPPQAASHALAEELGRKIDIYPEQRQLFLRFSPEEWRDVTLMQALEGNAMNLTGRLAEQSYFLGEVLGTKEYLDVEGHSIKGVIDHVKQTLRTLLLECQNVSKQTSRPNVINHAINLKSPLSDISSPISPKFPAFAKKQHHLYENNLNTLLNQLRTVLHRAAAIIIAVNQTQLDMDLLHLICWAPTYVWNVQLFRIVIPLWTWMAVEGGSQVEERMMMEFASGWEWTVKERIGMFNNRFTAMNPFEQKMTYTPSERPVQPATVLNSLLCHHLWIDFLAQRFDTIKERSSTQLTLFLNILENALDAHESWSIHPLARNARFGLLRLAMKVLQGQYFKSESAYTQMRRGIYHATLAWFQNEPQWSGVLDSRMIMSELSILADFHRLVRLDKQHLTDQKTSKGPISGIFQHLPDLDQPPPELHLNGTPMEAPLTAESRKAENKLSVPHGSLNTLHVWNKLENERLSIESRESPMSTIHSTTANTRKLRRIESLAASDQGSLLVLEEEEQKSTDDLFQKQTLMLILLESEMSRLMIWLNPGEATDKAKIMESCNINRKLWMFKDEIGDRTDSFWQNLIRIAWSVNPRIAVHLGSRFPSKAIRNELRTFVQSEPLKVVDVPAALPYLLTVDAVKMDHPSLKYLIYWAPITPVGAISLFETKYRNHPLVLQYAMRVLNHFPVDIVFFYIPQIVQALRYDEKGYVRQYILNTANTSQLFAHQIIWNMKANLYKDEESTVPDPLKPVLDGIMLAITDRLSGAAKEFYDREFNFFEKVTSISGKLKPFIKKSKPEKKKKIDEELRKIRVDAEVYLPSNPESIVVDIDYDSGKPLQSHAKAPFLATFKIKRKAAGPSVANPTVVAPKLGRPTSATAAAGAGESDFNYEASEDELTSDEQATFQTEELWQSSIFKVGDDCRQDQLALQLISCLKGIMETVGLDLYLYPYRVVATAPGVPFFQISSSVKGELIKYVKSAV